MKIRMTRRDRETYEAIKSWFDERGYMPSFRQIGDQIGLTSSSTVHARIVRLRLLGLVESNPAEPRTLRIVGCPLPIERIDVA